jgi:hypothetical protein
MANLLAKRYSEGWQIPGEVLSQALLLPIWTEIRTLLACRHVARELAIGTNSRFLIPVRSTRFVCFNYWGASDVASLYLAHELQRRGLDVALICEDAATGSSLDFTFVPSRAIQPLVQLWPFSLGKKAPVLICEAGIRQSKTGAAFVTSGLRLRQHHTMGRSLFGDALYSPFSRPRQAPLTITLEKSDNDGEVRCYRGAFPSKFAHRVLESFWANAAQKGWKNALALVKRRETGHAFVCDHHFFESAIAAGAIKANGGKVTILPHSSVPVHLPFRTSGSFDAAIAVMQTGAKEWATAFPDKRIDAQPNRMLPPLSGKTCFDPTEPLTVVMIAGAHRLGALPLMKIATHKQTWQDFLAVPAALQSEIKLVFKPKPGWEDQVWFEREFPASSIPVRCTFEQSTIAELNYPNMVFVCMTTASSAILEGIARGVPALIASDQSAENYIAVEDSPVPILPAKKIWDQIRTLTCATEYDKLGAAQMNWAQDVVYGGVEALHPPSRA